jgi:hypothetical protein
MKLSEILNEKVKTIKVGEDAIGASATHYGLVRDRVVVAIGEKQEMLELCEQEGGRVWVLSKEVGQVVEAKTDPCWKNYKQVGMKTKNGKEVPNCVPEGYDEDELTLEDFEEVFGGYDDDLEEAEYQGRKVELNKPMRGDVKKFKVYVKDPKTGNIKKVNFGQKGVKIKKNDPERRKSFRARHNCDNPGPKTKARYWSCRKW